MNLNRLSEKPTAASTPRRLRPRWHCLVATISIATGSFLQATDEAHHHHHRGQTGVPTNTTVVTATNKLSPASYELPPLPAGVNELKFSDFFVLPVGQRGLETTAKLRRLHGQRVRILGYMVHQEEPPAGRFLFTPMPAQIHEHDNGLADDLPASTLYVSVPMLRAEEVPYVPGLMLLTGTLSVGNQAEPDGRISVARLALDPSPSEASAPPSSPTPDKTLSTPTKSALNQLNTGNSRAENAAP